MCDGKLTLDECYRSLWLFESDKSPGIDVLMVKSNRAVWLISRNLMVDSLNCYYYSEIILKGKPLLCNNEKTG